MLNPYKMILDQRKNGSKIYVYIEERSTKPNTSVTIFQLKC